MINSKFYLQIKGHTVGTICATAYANIFMAEFEEKYIYPLIKDKLILFLRYIDNIFISLFIKEICACATTANANL